jgi:hypothetical protein
MATKRQPLFATLLFAALAAPFGIAAHLVSELAGLGLHDDVDVLFSARHGYLALIAFAAMAVIGAIARATPHRERRRRVAELVAALPMRGRGLGFVAISFALQFGFFAVTQIGEGCPLCGGDVLAGVLAAAVAALLGALLVAYGQRRFLEFACALVWLASARSSDDVSIFCARFRRANPRPVRRSPFAFRYRPPPLVA